MLQKLKSTIISISALAVILSFGSVGVAIAAQPSGTCFIHITGVTPPQQKCQAFIGNAAGRVDSDGTPLNYAKCYIVAGTSHSLSFTLSDCDGNPTPTTQGTAGKVMCNGPNGEPVACEVVSDPAAKGGNCADVSNCDLINNYINPFINFLAAGVGIAVVISIIIGGIQYGSSAGDSQKVTAAKARIRNAIIALLTFLFLYALLNFLIPGGLV